MTFYSPAPPDYRADWPDLALALDEEAVTVRVVKARTSHLCLIADLDLGAAPVHWRGISPGDEYVRLTAFDDGTVLHGAVCVDCASMFEATIPGAAEIEARATLKEGPTHV